MLLSDEAEMKPERIGRSMEATVAIRRQTPQEQRRFEAALELLLSEMVRQEIAGREEEQDGREETRR